MRLSGFLLLALVATSAFAADSSRLQKQAADKNQLEQQFHEKVLPFVGKYCAGCHGGRSPEAQLDLKSYTTVDQVRADFARWSLIAERLAAHEMPPKAMPRPPEDGVQDVIDFVHAVRTAEIKRLGGDPGVVLARRLSNAEYNYTVRDLTGQNLDVARQFPVDPANSAGFDNSGESLAMSPQLLNKYLQAARQVADTMVLKPEGIDFAPYPMLVATDREKYGVQNIIAFYQSQPTDYAKYFEAAWRYRYRGVLGDSRASLNTIANRSNLSAKYLPLIWDILNEKDAVGPVAKLQVMWRALPAPSTASPGADQLTEVAAQCAKMRDFATRIRAHTAMQFSAPIVKGLHGQSQPLHNWRLKQYAAHHRDSDPSALRADTDPPPVPPPIPDYPRLHDDASPRWAILTAHARAGDSDLIVPAAERARYQVAFARFASVFPDMFYVPERGRYWPDNSMDQGRLLSAGYHNTAGYYRDDTALMELILDEKGQRQLNGLWDQFDYIAGHTANTWTQFFLSESGEVNGKLGEAGSPRPVGRQITDTSVILELRDKYLAKAGDDKANDPDASMAIKDHFNTIDATLRHLEKERAATEPKHLAALSRFAERAYRRPLSAAERADLLAFYRKLRAESRLSHEDAIRESIVAVLMSPDFLYRFDLAEGPKAAAVKVKQDDAQPFSVQPLSSYALASRLSYFLWSTTPDAELLHHAAAGDLGKPDVLRAQARRMLKDPKVNGLATEFTGNWLAFRQFESNNSVDRARFPTFDDDLRESMFQEPVRFMQDIIRRDGSVLDIIYGDYTFVNPPLARHYGMPVVAGDKNTWVRVEGAGRFQRGGILPMAVFMTQYSPGLRTSPVKRGNWVVQKVLGIRVPSPPPAVPELPTDEAKTDLPIREMLAEHRKNPFCSSCHQRFDSFGLAFEGYGPVGNARTQDLAGRPIDASATFPGGVEAVGVAGLKSFIRDHRQEKFLENLSRKLLAYALNRSLQLSDEELVEQMMSNLAANGYRFEALVEPIVASPQFLNRRVGPPSRAPETVGAPTEGKFIKTTLGKGN
jgi:hypothetical protein